MRLCFNIKLPRDDLQRIGAGEGVLVGSGKVDRSGRLIGSSLRGYSNRELSRFYPLILCLETLTQINEWHLRQDNYAPLFDSGVYYQEEPPGEEEWLDIPTLYAQGFGDCEDIACAFTAELRHRGVPAVPCISFKDFDVGGKVVTLVHVLSLLPNDQIADPSKVLGMKGSYTDSV